MHGFSKHGHNEFRDQGMQHTIRLGRKRELLQEKKAYLNEFSSLFQRSGGAKAPFSDPVIQY